MQLRRFEFDVCKKFLDNGLKYRMRLGFGLLKNVESEKEFVSEESEEGKWDWNVLIKNLETEAKSKGSSMKLIEELREKKVGRQAEESFFEDETDEWYLDNWVKRKVVEKIVEEIVQESKNVPTLNKKIKPKNENRKAIDLIKAIKAKELENSTSPNLKPHHQSLNSPDSNEVNTNLKQNKNLLSNPQRPYIAKRSSTSNEDLIEMLPVSCYNTYIKKLPSVSKVGTTKAGSKALNEIKPSWAKGKQRSTNTSKLSGDNDHSKLSCSKALALYETPTTSFIQNNDSQQKEETLGPWKGATNAKKLNIAKRMTYASSESAVTQRASNTRRGKSCNSYQIVAHCKQTHKPQNKARKDVSIRKGKPSRSRQRKKSENRLFYFAVD